MSRLPPILSPKLAFSPASQLPRILLCTRTVNSTSHLLRSQLIIRVTVALERLEKEELLRREKNSLFHCYAFGAFGGIAFRDACNISITRHTGVPPSPPPPSSLPTPSKRLRSDGPTRASSSIEIPAVRPTPKKEFPRRGAEHPRRVHRAQNSGGTKDVYLVSPPLAWVSRRDSPTGRWAGAEEGRGRGRGRKASGIFDTGGMDRARPVRSDAGATLTWHVGRYQVLPRHRVDAERRRMCDSRSPSRPAHPFPLSSSFSPCCACRYRPIAFLPTLVPPPPSFLLVFARGEIHPCVVSPRRAPPLHYHHHHYHYHHHHHRHRRRTTTVVGDNK